jgi:hypothetical protein
LIEIKDPISNFLNHIKNRHNTKILFSAPFGTGKTTFLDHFFKGETDKYEVFKVFPVNYTVASNEDIFKYIKTDILFQLLGKDVKFDENKQTILQSFQEYIYLNPKKTIVSFLKNVSHLNSNVEILSKSIDALNDFIKPIIKYHEEQNKDERSIAEKYVKEIYENEGSLFEDNFYTQLIRQLLEQLKTKNKENVLIIEDLDRMDPEHIFRILNVISAHYDTYQYNENSAHHNKFGFDKIIIVCDINNIKSIFHHKYGITTDFNGYMNKYFSTTPFEYDNQMMIYSSIEKLFPIVNHHQIKMNDTSFKIMLQLLIGGNQLTLREILKLIRTDFNTFQLDENGRNYNYCCGVFTKPIAFFVEGIGLNNLINKVELLKEHNYQSNIDLNRLSKLLIATLGNGRNDLFYYVIRDTELTVKTDTDYNNFLIAEILEVYIIKDGLKTKIDNEFRFSQLDFYDLLIENIKKYNIVENSR